MRCRVPKVSPNETALTASIVELATKYGRYGHCRVTALLSQAGWRVNAKRVERIWRQEGLKYLPDSRKGSSYGLMTAHASGVVTLVFPIFCVLDPSEQVGSSLCQFSRTSYWIHLTFVDVIS